MTLAIFSMKLIRYNFMKLCMLNTFDTLLYPLFFIATISCNPSRNRSCHLSINLYESTYVI